MATIGSTLGPGIWTGNPSSFRMLCCRYGRRFGMISSSSPSPSPSPSLDTPTSGRCCYGLFDGVRLCYMNEHEGFGDGMVWKGRTLR